MYCLTALDVKRPKGVRWADIGARGTGVPPDTLGHRVSYLLQLRATTVLLGWWSLPPSLKPAQHLLSSLTLCVCNWPPPRPLCPSWVPLKRSLGITLQVTNSQGMRITKIFGALLRPVPRPGLPLQARRGRGDFEAGKSHDRIRLSPLAAVGEPVGGADCWCEDPPRSRKKATRRGGRWPVMR